MSEAEIKILKEAASCTLYTIQFVNEESKELKGFVLTLQKFDELIRQGEADGSIVVSENIIETDNTFDL